MTERIIRQPEVQAKTGLSRTSIWRMEKAGQFPRRRAIVGQVVGWVESEVDAWIRDRPAADPADR